MCTRQQSPYLKPLKVKTLMTTRGRLMKKNAEGGKAKSKTPNDDDSTVITLSPRGHLQGAGVDCGLGGRSSTTRQLKTSQTRHRTTGC